MTMNEVSKILAEHFTPEEILDVLRIDSPELVECLQDVIEEEYDRVVSRIKEDIGYVLD